jgi:signal transduction histidine kinase
MRYWLRGKIGGTLAFLAIAGLVAGGLGWVTSAALRLEQDQAVNNKLRIALYRMDSLVSPVIAREDSRPYSHYSAIYAPSAALNANGAACSPGTVLEPSPLLNAELADWILLHFQTDEESGWESPQVLSKSLMARLSRTNVKLCADSVTEKRARLLADLGRRFPHRELTALLEPRNGQQHGSEENTLLPAQGAWNYNRAKMNNEPASGQSANGSSEFYKRADVQAQTRQAVKADKQGEEPDVIIGNSHRNGEDWFSGNKTQPTRGEHVSVTLDSMAPLWMTSANGQEALLVARLVRIGPKEVCQGIVLDWPRLQGLLLERVNDLFPQGQVLPVREEVPSHPENSMSALPIELDPGPVASGADAPEWTPLRIGLTLAWLAALVALFAVGLGGWSLLELSQRRIRFVSTVTHELRTPLTTLRLYLDMLAGGIIKDEKQKTEYLQTLNAETDRLNRLVGNVLDFSRLENQRPRLEITKVALADLLEQVRSAWQSRCQDAGKELIIESVPESLFVSTDVKLVPQILGNLIDNACKYSRGAADRRIFLRARSEGRDALVLEVEDRGPGVPCRDRRSIFRPFRRGREANVTAGGVGLGLALAQRWAKLLGGRLTLQSDQKSPGACFRLELPQYG